MAPFLPLNLGPSWQAVAAAASSPTYSAIRALACSSVADRPISSILAVALSLAATSAGKPTTNALCNSPFSYDTALREANDIVKWYGYQPFSTEGAMLLNITVVSIRVSKESFIERTARPYIPGTQRTGQLPQRQIMGLQEAYKHPHTITYSNFYKN